VVLLAVLAPIVITLFLLLMERLEASLLPVVIRDVPRAAVAPEDIALQDVALDDIAAQGAAASPSAA
jgi:hypothetical protein